jgi:hypothetical protein
MYLTNEVLQQRVPSVFTTSPIPTASAKYCLIPTIRVIDALRERDLHPVSARQSYTRFAERVPFVKHVIRLRKANQPVVLGEIIPEIVLTNSHDTGSSYKLSAGLFRIWCSNGATTPVGEYGVYSVAHRGNVIDNVIEASYRIIDEHVPLLSSRVQEFQHIQLPLTRQLEFAERAASLRWDRPPVEPSELLEPRRQSDAGDDLWRVFNRVQENIVRGGIRYRHLDIETGRLRRSRTRPIRSVSQDLDFNVRLWRLAEEYAGNEAGLEYAGHNLG